MTSPSHNPRRLRADSSHSAPNPTKQTQRSTDSLLSSPPSRHRNLTPSCIIPAPARQAPPAPVSLPALETFHDDASNRNSLNLTKPLPTPPPSSDSSPHSRSSSMDFSTSPGTMTSTSNSRPKSSSGLPRTLVRRSLPSTSNPERPKEEKKNGWFGRHKTSHNAPKPPAAWIAGQVDKQPYDLNSLVSAQSVEDICDGHNGDCLVYLWPRGSNKGPSFKVDSSIFAASPVLMQNAFGEAVHLRQAPTDEHTHVLTVGESPPQQLQQASIYLPVGTASDISIGTHKAGSKSESLAMDDLQALVDMRNFFAFLSGQSLIATGIKESLFSIFMTIAGFLKTYEFTNLDGTTFGDVVTESFNGYVQELNLADCRVSSEATIEALILGERMRNVMLYNEAFTHAAGKREEILATKSDKLPLISEITMNRLVRAAMDLDKRIGSIQLTLNAFDFPMIKNSAIMNSKVSEERKEGVRFDQWWDAFTGTRKYVHGLYQARYGHWPPKAKCKKNNLETDGLNRLVCRDLYSDMSGIYDLLVDRNSLTTRTANGVEAAADKEAPTIRGLRFVLDEYDGASPPVKPPIPFDVPKLPTLKTTRPDYGTGNLKADLKAQQTKLKDDEIARILRASWNDDAVVTPFVNAFREMERRAAHGCTIGELVELRIGQWIFTYSVLQALPMLACDAPSVRYTQGVEYFLCQPPRGGVPWAVARSCDASSTAAIAGSRRTWYSVGDGGGLVSLPSDVVEHGVEGIYRRSHCWTMAEKWTVGDPKMNEALHVQARTAAHLDSMTNESKLQSSSLSVPSPNPGLHPYSRDSSPRPSSRRSSYMGLEALSMPYDNLSSSIGSTGFSPGPISRTPTPVHVVDASKTFDSILGGVPGQTKGKKK
ncbi:Hypothetical protein R9X50_00632500 [Acrodontium crateriforme]|uniref:DUF8004 domain-containing protein n=1 Tax=Acrodontium crateriforme TaxID=150365 RepID=A0AAQ3M8X8_9PEZI|nr:Hypothetical protein R9X50_00632500 [Acrodontium crateriforme]